MPPIEPVWSGDTLVGDDLIELARAVLGALADHGRGLAADFAGRRLALAELAHVRHRRGRGRHGFRRVDLRQLVRFRCLVSAATARAPARARMPCEAEKTSRDPGRLLGSVAVDPAIGSRLTAVDKSQVFALRLNRRKFAKNPTDLIRCKFSIDARLARWMACVRRIHHFETIPGWCRKPDVHHLRRMQRARTREKPREHTVFGRAAARLSVRLMSL